MDRADIEQTFPGFKFVEEEVTREEFLKAMAVEGDPKAELGELERGTLAKVAYDLLVFEGLVS